MRLQAARHRHLLNSYERDQKPGARRVAAQKVKIRLSGGEIELPHSFIEFVWRYPKADISQPKQWGDYFTDFVAATADDVVESLYKD